MHLFDLSDEEGELVDLQLSSLIGIELSDNCTHFLVAGADSQLGESSLDLSGGDAFAVVGVELSEDFCDLGFGCHVFDY